MRYISNPEHERNYDETYEDMVGKYRAAFSLYPIQFRKEVQAIMREVKEKVIKEHNLPKDFVFDCDIIMATTKDDYTFMCRMDLLDVLKEPEWHLEGL